MTVLIPVKLGNGAKLTVPDGFAVNVPSPETVRVASTVGVEVSRSSVDGLKLVEFAARLSLASTAKIRLTLFRVVPLSLPASGEAMLAELGCTWTVADMEVLSVPSLAV